MNLQPLGIAKIILDYTKAHSREDVPEQQSIKPKKQNPGWEDIRKRNRERRMDALRRQLDL